MNEVFLVEARRTPFGAFGGARLAATLVRELQTRRQRYGVASLCIGGGEAVAAVFERC